MKTKKAAAPLKPLRTNMLIEKKLMLTEEELITAVPEYKDFTPEKRAEIIEFVYEISLVLYNCANSQNFNNGKT